MGFSVLTAAFSSRGLKYWVVNRALTIFDTNDLSTQKRAEHLALSRELDEIRNFTEGLREGLLEDARSSPQAATLDQANYIPSSSLRGDSGCIAANCRLPKIRVMARYIALYCDTAVVPVRIPPITKKGGHRAEIFDRFHLLSVILGILELRPLLEAGLVTLVPGELRLCSEHWNQGVPERKRILTSALALAEENARRFSVTYYPPQGPLKSPTLYYKGPEEFLEHGEIRVVLESVPKWLSRVSPRRPLKLSQPTIKARKSCASFLSADGQ